MTYKQKLSRRVDACVAVCAGLDTELLEATANDYGGFKRVLQAGQQMAAELKEAKARIAELESDKRTRLNQSDNYLREQDGARI